MDRPQTDFGYNVPENVNDRELFYNTGYYKDKEGNVVKNTVLPNTVKNGLYFRNTMIVVLLLSIFSVIACGIGIDKTIKKTIPHYIYISGCSIAGFMIIYSIIVLRTTARSLEVEDIMVTAMQRMSAGRMQIKEFQQTAGNYFKQRLHTGAHSGISDQEFGREVGRNLLGN